MILPAAADVAIIRHIARALGATSHGVTLATRGHTCAGNATDRGMNSKIAASSSQDTEVLVAMVDLRDNTEIVPIAIIQVDLRGYCHGNTLSYENCYRAFVGSGQRTASEHAGNVLVCSCCRLELDKV